MWGKIKGSRRLSTARREKLPAMNVLDTEYLSYRRARGRGLRRESPRNGKALEMGRRPSSATGQGSTEWSDSIRGGAEKKRASSSVC